MCGLMLLSLSIRFFFQKVRIHKEYHTTVYVPSLYLEPPPPRNQREGGGQAHSPAGEGWGSPNSDDWRKSLALCLLCEDGVLMMALWPLYSCTVGELRRQPHSGSPKASSIETHSPVLIIMKCGCF